MPEAVKRVLEADLGSRAAYGNDDMVCDLVSRLVSVHLLGAEMAFPLPPPRRQPSP